MITPKNCLASTMEKKRELARRNKIELIMVRVRIFASRYYKYPFPKEPFFSEVAQQSIADAHGGQEQGALDSKSIRLLWSHLKAQSLRYVTMVRLQLRNRFMPHGQKAYYAGKLDATVETLDEKAAQLESQFSDADDLR